MGTALASFIVASLNFVWCWFFKTMQYIIESYIIKMKTKWWQHRNIGLMKLYF